MVKRDTIVYYDQIIRVSFLVPLHSLSVVHHAEVIFVALEEPNCRMKRLNKLRKQYFFYERYMCIYMCSCIV